MLPQILPKLDPNSKNLLTQARIERPLIQMSKTEKKGKELNIDAIQLILDLKEVYPRLCPADQEIISKVIGKQFLS